MKNVFNKKVIFIGIILILIIGIGILIVISNRKEFVKNNKLSNNTTVEKQKEVETPKEKDEVLEEQEIQEVKIENQEKKNNESSENNNEEVKEKKNNTVNNKANDNSQNVNSSNAENKSSIKSDSTLNSKKSTSTSTTNSGNNTNKSTGSTSSKVENSNTAKNDTPTQVEKTKAQKNDEVRNRLKSKYDVTVGYKDEIDGKYLNSYARPTKIYDDDVIGYNLTKVENALNKYPSSFFSEIKNKWKPVSIYLVDNINGYAAGLTDNNNPNTIVILIVVTHNPNSSILESTIHHEMMHAIDCYFTSKGIYSSYDLEQSMMQFNPEGFVYGNQSNQYVYLLDNSYYFVSKYAKSNYKEDRAEIFANLMYRSIDPGYFRDGGALNKKAKVISDQIGANFSSASSYNNRWDRFIGR